jgi:L-lactate dehydrogenase complex protein LldF
MSVEFDRKIHNTLADANLQLAIYTATARLKENRIETVAPDALPDYQELRTQANAVKKHTIENLDYYLRSSSATSKPMAARWCTPRTARKSPILCWRSPKTAARG